MPGSAVPMGTASPVNSLGTGWHRANVVASVGPYALNRTVPLPGLFSYQRRTTWAFSCSPPISTRPTVVKQSGTAATTVLNRDTVMNIVSMPRSRRAVANSGGLCTTSSWSTTQTPPVRSGVQTSKLSASKAGLDRQPKRLLRPCVTYRAPASLSTPASVTSTPLGRPVVPDV